MDEKFDANQTFADLLASLNMNSEVPEKEEIKAVEETAPLETPSPVIQVVNLSVSEELATKVEAEATAPAPVQVTPAQVAAPVPARPAPVQTATPATPVAPAPVQTAAPAAPVAPVQATPAPVRTAPVQVAPAPAAKAPEDTAPLNIDEIFERAEQEHAERKAQGIEAVEVNLEGEPKEYYSLVETTGLIFGSFFIGIWALLSKIVLNVYNLVKKCVTFLWTKFYENVILAVKNFKSEWKTYKREQAATSGQIRSDIRTSPLSFFKILRYYTKAFYGRHPMMFSNFINTVLPIAGFVILVSTIIGIKSTTYALEVKANGAELGYVENESIYLNAQSLVKERFNTAVKDDSNNADVGATYKIVEVKANELLDSSTVSDNIIEKADTKATYACGIYIDDEFLCAVSSETDAMQVFNNILDANKTSNSNDTVGFVEDVQYVQGLYEDNDSVIWTTDKLSDVLTGKKTNSTYYTVKEGDTLSKIAHAYGMTVKELKAANPSVTGDIQEGDQLLVSHEKSYLNIKVVKTIVQKEAIAYKTIKTNNSKLYKGTNKVTQKGKKGVDSVTYLVTYVNGVKKSSKEINRVTISDPVDEKISVGTKVIKGYTSSSYRKGYGKLIWPAVGVYKVSSKYGYRTMNGRTKFHRGIDLSCAGASGHTVVAAASGTVTTAGYDSSYGYYVMINHGNGMVTLYAHMQKGSIRVKVGQKIGGGTAIGKVGSTGHSTGPHLHFEVRINGKNVNPAPYIGA